MNARSVVVGLAALGATIVAAAGCGGAGGPAPTHVVKADVGGQAVWIGDPTYFLPGVTVTLTDVDGDTWTATTNSQGLWVIENVNPGAYIETYAAPGYETITDTLIIEAIGENDVKNVFISRGSVEMEETRLRATVMPFNVVLRDGDELLDGFNGISASYDSGDVVVTFNRRILNPSTMTAYLYDDPSSTFAPSVVESANEMVFTISDADIAAMDGGAGPFTDTDPYTWTLSVLFQNVQSYTPIHGELESFDALLGINAVP